MVRSALVASVLVVLGFLGAPARAGDAVPLWKAAKDELVAVKVLEVEGFSRAKIGIKSKTDKELSST